jgi:predicted O-linked N-acetylglucosamine transferase (SPINDLY family)
VDEAIEAACRAQALIPDSPDALVALGNAFREAGRASEALAAYRKALALTQTHPASLKSQFVAVNNLLFTLLFDPDQNRASIGAEHTRWIDQIVRPKMLQFVEHPNDCDPGRRLRIGYVSPDFSQSPIGRFMLPLLANHDHRAFEICCYSDIRRPDAMTERLRASADLWRDTRACSDEQFVELVRRDAVDILVDLSLHTRGNRLLAFAPKPAPVQVSYLAYAGTTGLPAMDYRLTDPYLDPPELPDSCYSEKSVRLPNCFWCYQPISERVPVNEPPASANGFVTFGCLNNYCKVNPLTFSNWCRLLKQVRESRLMLFGEPGEHRQRAWQHLEQEGVDPRRLSFTGLVPAEEYLRQYQQIDIALDPFPYGGGTTTFDALWMGVPVVSLVGETAVSRAGLSILSNLRLAELTAMSWEEYPDKAAALATDRARLALLRSTLRQRMQSSPLMDGPRFARDVEAAFRQMWHNFVHCAPCHG